MPNTYNSSTLSGTYRDDWDADDNYHQVLFNSGRALQARELNTLQTILQREAARHGRNIFKEGARVSNGGITCDNQYRFVKIASTSGPTSFSNIPVGTVLTGGTSGAVAKVLEVVPAADSDPDTLYIYYTGAGSAAASSTSKVFDASENLTGGGYTLTVAGGAATGAGTRLLVGEGDFFVLGHFVAANQQSIFLSKYSQNVDTKVVYEVTEDVITVADTTDLYDNTGGSPNLAAPGADRYRIRLTLKKEEDVTTGATNVYLCTVENSRVVEENLVFDGFNQINKVLAERTAEESGNYIVNPFILSVGDEDTSDSDLEMIISTGTAYINGFRVHNQYPQKIKLPRALGTELVENDTVPFSYGNYVLSDSAKGLPDLDLATANLKDAADGSGSTLGTARIRSVDIDGIFTRVYLFDVQMNAGQKFSDVKSIGNSTTDRFSLVLEGGQAVIKDAANNDLLFPAPRPRPQNVSDVVITTQRRFTGTGGGSGTLTVSGLGANETFVEADRWIVASDQADSDIRLNRTDTPITILGGSTSAIVSFLKPGVNYEIYALVQDGAGVVRTKTLTNATSSGTLNTGGDIEFYDIGFPDVQSITSVKLNDSDGEDISNLFIFDNGQTDNYYGPSRLILKNGIPDPGNIFTRFEYWQRTSTGNFYAATSYANTEYKDIPTHRLLSGEVIQLRNVLDFRPDFDGTTFTQFGGATNIELPRNGDTLTADIEYYTPRADKILLTQEGDFQILKGVQAENPQFKPTPENALELYKLILRGNTDGPEDVKATAIEHKRYTMKDINKLERQLNKLEEQTALSLLELEAKIEALFDSDGVERTDVGILVDDFQDQTGADTELNDYDAAVDPEQRLVRAGFDEDNIRLVYDSAAVDAGSYNAKRKGDLVTINYVDSDWQTQNLASTTRAVNQAGLVRNVGCLVLSPASDEWKESEYKATYAVPGATRLGRQQAFLWNNWQWNWGGREAENTSGVEEEFIPRNRQFGAFGRRSLVEIENYQSSPTEISQRYGTNNSVSRVVSSETVRELVGNRTVDIALIPWMRSRRISFKAMGLKPNTTFKPFFDGIDVSAWVKEEPFERWGARVDSDQGNLLTSPTTTGIDGATDLVSDADGNIEGSFLIPNIRPAAAVEQNTAAVEGSAGLRFRTGAREFKLVDITETDTRVAGSQASAIYVAKGTLETTTTNIGSTRYLEWAWSLPGVSEFGIFNVYNQLEVKDLLDNESTINLVEPHPSGSWGPTDAAAGRIANPADFVGNQSLLINDYATVDENQFGSTTSILPTAAKNNPMAQTFKVDNQYGLVVTKVSLFFASKDDTYPVSVQIRPMRNGAPSEYEIVPGACAYVSSANVNATAYTAGSTELSTVQAAPTVFEFEEPVFLKPWTEYALVVVSESPEYEVYVAKALDYIIGSGGSQRITSQPAPGSLYLSQNSTQWQPSKDLDLMYTITRAKFDTNASAIFGNAPIPDKLLKTNPIRLFAASDLMYVQNRGHGLDSSASDNIVISGVPTGTYSGLSESQINGTRPILKGDIDGVLVQADAFADSDLKIGGEDVAVSRNIQFVVANPQMQTLVPPATSIDVGAKFTTGRSVSGTETKYTKDAFYNRVTPGQNVSFPSPRILANPDIETSQLGAGVKSCDVKVDLFSSNDYVSPVIDLQRCSLTLVNNAVDDPVAAEPILTRDETLPYMGDANGGSRHITSPVQLGDDAVGVRINVNQGLPPNTAIDMYWRTATSAEDILDQSWTSQAIQNVVPNDASGNLRNAEYLVGGTGGLNAPFNQFQAKFVMRSTNMAASPIIKDLKMKFLGV